MAGTLHLLCGKIAAGKSTLAARLAEAPEAVLIGEDRWTSALFREEMSDVADYVRISARLRAAMGPHVTELLRAGVDVVLDFPGNTRAARALWREAARQAGARILLHWIDAPDKLCRDRLERRNAAGEHEFAGVTSEQFDLITRYFEAPEDSEGLIIVREPALGTAATPEG